MKPPTKKIALVFGTRPEIIKLSAIIRSLEAQKRDYFMIHTGQHYSYEMDQLFFKELELPDPRYKFTRPAAVGPNMHAELVDKMMPNILGALKAEKPSAVLVQGDTDTVLAGARAAKEIGGMVIGHVEAGLRSYDDNMPEERNRIQTDRLSDILFAPTEAARRNLIREKLDSKQVVVTGNTIVDAIFGNLELAKKNANKGFQKGYALVTMHRPESVDSKERLTDVIRALEIFAKKSGLRVIFPVHPRTAGRLKEFGLDRLMDKKLILTPDPMGFLNFLWYEKNADVILTDSGGVQEEACILKVPCVTIRTTTERPETVEVGGNVVSGYDPDHIVSCAMKMMKVPKDWPNPFGDGRASERILNSIEDFK